MPCRLQCMLQVSTQVDGNLCCNQKRQLLHHSHVIQSAAALFFCINLTDDGADHKSIACLRIFPDVLAWSGAFLEFTASYVACCFLFSQPILDFVRTRAHRIRNLMVFHCDQQTDSEPTLLLSCLYLLTYIWQMSVVTSCHGSQGTEVGNYQMSWSSGVQSIFCRRRSDRGLRWVGRGTDVMRRHVASQFSEVLPALMIMRTYALYERSRGVLALLLAVAIGVIIVACVCLP